MGVLSVQVIIAGGRELSQCRICGSAAIAKCGEVEFYFGYAWPIYDCDGCGCRFTRHDTSAYDLLYTETGSCYNRYIGLSEATKAAFDRRDLAGLRAALSKARKYRHIIEQVAAEPTYARLLEIGCSRGHLTSHFILENRPITGIDVSPKAVAAAIAAFGNHFMLAGDPRIEAQAPYDLIYHVGTIGCVADPIGMTRDLLRMLKPGGRLLFNSPNRDSCALPDQLWFDSAPPPDVVTMYRPGFWRRYFGELAEVNEEIEQEPPRQNFFIALRRVVGRRWKKPSPIPLNESQRTSAPTLTRGDRLWRDFERVIGRIGPWTGVFRLAPPAPSEFGLLVTMRKR
jgi:SAM-dependent methyltransferase